MLNKKNLILAIVLYNLPILASASTAKINLINSCVELINIFDSKKSKRLLAAQTTSLTESLRAGYCLGVIEQYAKSESHCRSDWFKRAEFIAKYALEENPLSEKNLLRLSCEI